jgi:sigma-E processing peptidase SpoIIGA
MLLSSAIGGIYSVISVLFSLNSVLSLTVDALVCVVMCAIVFAEKETKAASTLLCSFLFVGISMMTGGCMTALFNLLNRMDLPLDNIAADGLSTYAFAIIAAVAGFISLKSGQLISHRSTVTECEMEISIGGKSIVLKSLVDSGNLIKDPISGKSVIVIDKRRLNTIVDTELYESFIRGDRSDSAPRGIRLIPINTAGGRSMLAASSPDKATIRFTDRNGKQHTFDADVMIAPSDIQQSADGYSAIIPAEIIKS